MTVRATALRFRLPAPQDARCALPGRNGPVTPPREGTAPDGVLACYRRHSNGFIAAVVRHAEGMLTARRWPQPGPYQTGLHDLSDARSAADEIAHPGCDGFGCARWKNS